ncbi:MAG TPA: DNA polymerase III subunit delta [Candidatus Limnocylindrales bacterium]|nr:DNA polymerase III subunit delta [Candidatus Limnocylindrales bacterium]
MATAAALAPLAYLHGEDAYGIARAVRELAAALGGEMGALQVWRSSADEDAGTAGAAVGAAVGGRRSARRLDEIEQRLATAPLFGGGTLVVVEQPAPLLRERVARDRLLALVAQVPPGNGLVFTELAGRDARRTTAGDALRQAVQTAGGSVREFPALAGGRMEQWLGERAAELGIRLGPGAARLLTERVGAAVREGDVDRRRQSELADAELQKLALYRPDGTVERADVAELVPESVPASAWAFQDAVGLRRAGEAARLLERLLADGTALPVVLGQLHRRLRDLILVREHLASGTRASALPRAMGLNPYRAERLAQQAQQWSLAELEAAFDGLLAVDLASKGISLDGTSRGMSEERSAFALLAWLAGSVARG